jgi:N-acetylmuramoyl-L-alanine amidase
LKKFLIFAVGAALIKSSFAIDPETRCLAKAIYYEARGEPWQGKVAVAITTLNRVRDPRFPKTICRVVFQPYQYSWTLDKTRRITNKQDWDEAVFVATLTKHTLYKLPHNFPALYFHSAKVRPPWRHKQTRITQIGNHIFYY